jgi:hypothetical protein
MPILNRIADLAPTCLNGVITSTLSLNLALICTKPQPTSRINCAALACMNCTRALQKQAQFSLSTYDFIDIRDVVASVLPFPAL